MNPNPIPQHLLKPAGGLALQARHKPFSALPKGMTLILGKHVGTFSQQKQSKNGLVFSL